MFIHTLSILETALFFLALGLYDDYIHATTYLYYLVFANTTIIYFFMASVLFIDPVNQKLYLGLGLFTAFLLSLFQVYLICKLVDTQETLLAFA